MHQISSAVLQRVAVCCSVLRCVTGRWGWLGVLEICSGVFKCGAVNCSALQEFRAVYKAVLKCSRSLHCLASLFALLYRHLRLLCANSKGSFGARQGSFGVLQMLNWALFEKCILFCCFKNDIIFCCFKNNNLTRWCIADLLCCVAVCCSVLQCMLQLLQSLQCVAIAAVAAVASGALECTAYLWYSPNKLINILVYVLYSVLQRVKVCCLHPFLLPPSLGVHLWCIRCVAMCCT